MRLNFSLYFRALLQAPTAHLSLIPINNLLSYIDCNIKTLSTSLLASRLFCVVLISHIPQHNNNALRIKNGVAIGKKVYLGDNREYICTLNITIHDTLTSVLGETVNFLIAMV